MSARRATRASFRCRCPARRAAISSAKHRHLTQGPIGRLLSVEEIPRLQGTLGVQTPTRLTNDLAADHALRTTRLNHVAAGRFGRPLLWWPRSGDARNLVDVQVI